MDVMDQYEVSSHPLRGIRDGAEHRLRDVACYVSTIEIFNLLRTPS